jgi:hypothetical protein
MTIEDALKTLLKSGLSTTRVYAFKAPQPLPAPTDDPYTVIFRISPTPRHVQTGPVPTIERRYQFSTFGKSHAVAMAVSDNLRRLLDGYSGEVSDGLSPESTIRISSAMWAGETYNFNDTTAVHHFAVDMQIKYREPE